MNLITILKKSLEKNRPLTVSKKRLKAYHDELDRLRKLQQKKAKQKRSRERIKTPEEKESARQYRMMRKQESALGELTVIGKELSQIAKELGG